MTSRRDYDSEILRLAALSGGVLHDRDLAAANIPPRVVRRRLDSSMMARIIGGSYGVGPLAEDPTFEMRCMAGAKAAGALGRIDGVTAAVLLRVWTRRCDIVHASAPSHTMSHRHDGYRFTRVRGVWLPDAEMHVGRIPVVEPVRILATMACDHTAWQVANVVDGLAYQELVTLEQASAHAQRRQHAPGNVTFRAAIDLIRAGSVGTRSSTEDALIADLLAAGLPIPIVNTRGAMGLVRDEPDIVYPHLRANIECDGPQHDDPRQRRDDDARDVQLEAMGWRILRVRARDFWRRRRFVVAQILRLLAGEVVPVVPGTRTLLVP